MTEKPDGVENLEAIEQLLHEASDDVSRTISKVRLLLTRMSNGLQSDSVIFYDDEQDYRSYLAVLKIEMRELQRRIEDANDVKLPGESEAGQ